MGCSGAILRYIYIYISFVSLSRFFETIYILFKTVECVNMLAHAHTYTYTGKSSARDHLFFTQQRGGYVTRLDTHNQPAVIEAFNAWPRTLTRSYACTTLSNSHALCKSIFDPSNKRRRARTPSWPKILLFLFREVSNWVWNYSRVNEMGESFRKS